MKILLEFTAKDLENSRSFNNATERQIGHCYTGTNSMSIYFDFPRELVGLLRPKSGNVYLSREEYEDFENRLKEGKIIFELDSSKPAK